MNSALELIEAIQANGGTLTVDGEWLLVEPRSAGEPMVEQLRQHKSEILALLRGRMTESLIKWLTAVCARNDTWFTNIDPLHSSFCAWQSKRGGAEPSLCNFRQMLLDEEFLIGEVAGTTLVSGLAFKSDMNGVPTPPNRA